MVLAAQAPDLHEVLERAAGEGLPQVILDGKIIPADRRKEKTISVNGEVVDLWYSGKAHAHGGNIQAVCAPDEFPLRVSDVEPGSVHDITAAPIHALPALYRAAARGLPGLADPGYDGAGIGIHIPVRQPADGRDLDISTRTRNALQRSLRCLGERGVRAAHPAVAHPPAHHRQPPAESATSPARPSSSPITSTATSHQFAEGVQCSVSGRFG